MKKFLNLDPFDPRSVPANSDSTKVCNVAFSGSGLLFPIHMGAWRAFLEKSGITHLSGVSGTSGGSIVAALIACGHTIERMEHILSRYDLASMIEFNFGALFKMSFCDGKKVDKALYDIFGNTTLGQTQVPLYVTASDVNAGEGVVFSSETHPDLPIRTAVRASLSIPFVFTPVQHENKVLVDGMLFSSTPFTVFRDNPYRTVGIALRSSSDKNYMRKTRFLPSYVMRLFELTLKGLNYMHIRLSEEDDDVTLNVIDAAEYDVLGDYDRNDLLAFGYKSMIDLWGDVAPPENQLSLNTIGDFAKAAHDLDDNKPVTFRLIGRDGSSWPLEATMIRSVPHHIESCVTLSHPKLESLPSLED